MVFYYTSVTSGGTFTLYMGKDKYENEELIRHGWSEDVWFHVDDLSSAHVYVRLPEEMTIADMPTALINDCAQLVKANSIEGNKKATGGVKVVYTPWSNLAKSSSMAVGQVGFVDGRALRYVSVERKDNAVVNRLNKTRSERDTSYIKESKDARDAELRARAKEAKRKAAADEAAAIEERRRAAAARSYDNVFASENMTSNAEVRMSSESADDDFM